MSFVDLFRSRSGYDITLFSSLDGIEYSQNILVNPLDIFLNSSSLGHLFKGRNIAETTACTVGCCSSIGDAPPHVMLVSLSS